MASTAPTSPREQVTGGVGVPADSAEDRKNDRNTMARAYLHCIRAQQAAERDAMYPDSGLVDSRSPDVSKRNGLVFGSGK